MLPAFAAVLAAAPQQDAQSIIATMQEKQAERWETVENYTVIQSAFGMRMPIYYEKVLVGNNQPMFRMVSATEYQEQPPGGTQNMIGEMADAYELMADSMEGQQGMQGMGMGSMFRDMSGFMRATESAEVPDTRADATGRAADMQVIAERARLVGRETIDGRDAFHLRVEDLSGIEFDQPDGDGQYTLNAMSLWIDAREYVTLQFNIEGVIESDGKQMPMVLEKRDQDYRQVGPMYEPHRQVMRISGMQHALDPKQQQELERARAQMEQVKAQLAEMPEAQRRMVEGRMKSSMEMLERMTGGDGSMFETVIEIVEIRINEGPPTPEAMAGAFAGEGVTLERERARGPVPSPVRDDPPGRTDLERFIGVYGDPNQSDERRRLFVTESCDGRMVVGAMWGDASNWWMTSVGDTEFEMSDQFRSLSLLFAVGADGNATAMHHDLDNLPNPLTKVGPLPEGYGDCVQDPRG
jgi:hypothetical protein